MDPEVAAALDALRAALARAGGRTPLFVEVLYSDGRVDRLSLAAAALAGGAPGNGQGARPATAPGGLRGLILARLGEAERPLKQAALARRCDRSNSGHFRDVLEAMVASGEVRRLPAGDYWLPGRAIPDEQG